MIRGYVEAADRARHHHRGKLQTPPNLLTSKDSEPLAHASAREGNRALSVTRLTAGRIVTTRPIEHLGTSQVG